MLRMRSGLLLIALISFRSFASPVDFGKAELKKRADDRGLHGFHVDTVIKPGPPESFEISPRTITGSDERGLMYGLLAAAEQIREQGRLVNLRQTPHTKIRGIRIFIHNADLERTWYFSREYWDGFFGMLARNRFNRFNLVFAHQTDYLAPPYPFWVALPEFPQIRALHVTAAERERNLEMLRYISDDAAAHGIDFTLGIWEQNIQDFRKPPMVPMTEGLTAGNIGPYTYAALKKVLQLCPCISSVQIRTNSESGIPADRQLPFYRDYFFRAIKDAGRPVILDLRAWAVVSQMIDAATGMHIPVRVSTKYWAEFLGRPYQPAETYAGYSYGSFLRHPRRYAFYWELWGLGSHRLLLWGSPYYVRRAISTFGLGDADGFEIDPPLAQKGFGNAPGRWGIFTESQPQRVFWKWEFERYWLFYRLWGRLSYDPSTPDSAWMNEMGDRFGSGAAPVMRAYEAASKVINEIVAVHLADPNMYIWPEINPGGVIDSYKEVLPSDWAYVASIREAVDNRIRGIASAKQTPFETAARLQVIADDIDRATSDAQKLIPAGNREWLSTQADFRVLSLLARYHAHKQRAAYALEFFDRTADPAALDDAHRELSAGAAVWRELSTFTDGLYPRNMSFGPDDAGEWKDKLPYVEYDLKAVEERERILKQFGRFTIGFDFGGPVKTQPSRNAYDQTNYVLQNNVEPRYIAIDSDTLFAPQRGYGWLDNVARQSVAIPLAPYLEVRAVSRKPQDLPHDVLFRDYVTGHGPQRFAVTIEDGKYSVTFLHPDHSANRVSLTSEGRRLIIPFPEGDWSVSGLVISGRSQSPAPVWTEPKLNTQPAPAFSHTPPAQAQPGQPLRLRLVVHDASHVRLIRLHYRALDQNAGFRTIDAQPGETFTIPANDVPSAFDLMYYFEILNDQGGGWFHPDPQRATPYYVVPVGSQDRTAITR